MKTISFHRRDPALPPAQAMAAPSDDNGTEGMVYVRIDVHDLALRKPHTRFLEELHVRVYVYLHRAEAERLRDHLTDALMDERVSR